MSSVVCVLPSVASFDIKTNTFFLEKLFMRREKRDAHGLGGQAPLNIYIEYFKSGH